MRKMIAPTRESLRAAEMAATSVSPPATLRPRSGIVCD
jgi:hypothetical protein